MADESASSPVLNLQLNIDAILMHGQNAVVLSSEIVDFMFNALETADLSKKPINEATQYKFKTPDLSAADRRAMYENWIFLKSFQDLMRGVRASLEQAYLFLQILAAPPVIKSNSTLEEFLDPFRIKAEKLNFVDLLAQVNLSLPEPLHFVDAYLSLQKARNCLEHRRGIVGSVDAPAGGVMILKFPRMKTFYLQKGKEIELEPGHIVDAQDDAEHVQIVARVELRELRFSKGQRVSFSTKDFNEIAFGCNYFVSDLAGKVAKLVPSAPSSTLPTAAPGKTEAQEGPVTA